MTDQNNSNLSDQEYTLQFPNNSLVVKENTKESIRSVVEETKRSSLAILSRIKDIVDLSEEGISKDFYEITTDGKIRFIKENWNEKNDFLEDNFSSQEIKNLLANLNLASRSDSPEIFFQRIKLILDQIPDSVVKIESQIKNLQRESTYSKTRERLEKYLEEWQKLQFFLNDWLHIENEKAPSHFNKTQKSVETKVNTLDTSLQNKASVYDIKDLTRATLCIKRPLHDLDEVNRVLKRIIYNYHSIYGRAGYVSQVVIKPKYPKAENQLFGFLKSELGESCYLGNGYTDITLRFVYISDDNDGKRYKKFFELQINTQSNIEAKKEETENYDCRKALCEKLNKILNKKVLPLQQDSKKSFFQPEEVNWIMRGFFDRGIIDQKGKVVDEEQFGKIIAECLKIKGYNLSQDVDKTSRGGDNFKKVILIVIKGIFSEYAGKFMESYNLFSSTKPVVSKHEDVEEVVKTCDNDVNLLHKFQVISSLKNPIDLAVKSDGKNFFALEKDTNFKEISSEVPSSVQNFNILYNNLSSQLMKPFWDKEIPKISE